MQRSMQRNHADTTGRLASLAGGILMAVGSLLTWGKVAVGMPGVGTQETSFKGLDTGDGKILLALAILILAVTLAAFVIRGVLGVGPVLVSLAGGAFALVLGIINTQNVTPTAVSYLVKQAGFGPQEFNPAARDVLEAATNATVGIGLYLAVVGGVVALLGGLLDVGRIRGAISRRGAPGEEWTETEAILARTGEAPPEAPTPHP